MLIDNAHPTLNFLGRVQVASASPTKLIRDSSVYSLFCQISVLNMLINLCKLRAFAGLLSNTEDNLSVIVDYANLL